MIWEQDQMSKELVTETSILLAFFDACRRATTIGEMNVAAGIARSELLDLAEDRLDHLRDLFEVPDDRV